AARCTPAPISTPPSAASCAASLCSARSRWSNDPKTKWPGLTRPSTCFCFSVEATIASEDSWMPGSSTGIHEFLNLNLEAVPELRREQILRLQQPVECALLVAIGEEGLDRLAVAFDAVGEGVGAEQLRVVVGVVEAPGNREARGRHLGRAVEAAALGFLEALEQRHGDPGRPLVEVAPDGDDMHDREDAGLLVVIELDRLVVGEQADDVGIAVLET